MNKTIAKKVFEAMVFVNELAEGDPTNDAVWYEFYDMKFAGYGEALTLDEFYEYKESLIAAGFVSTTRGVWIDLYAPTEAGRSRLAKAAA